MTSLLKFRDLTSFFYAACELSQPMGKTEFSSIAKNGTKLCLIGKRSVSHPWSSRLYGWIACMEREYLSRVLTELKTPSISNHYFHIIALEATIQAGK